MRRRWLDQRVCNCIDQGPSHKTTRETSRWPVFGLYAEETTSAPNLVRLRRRGLQSRATAETHGGIDVSAPANCQLVGRWRIVEADLWDRDYLDLCGPAAITVGAEGCGEIAFGAMEGCLDIEYSRLSITFT